MTVDELKYEILNSELDDFVERNILTVESLHFPLEQKRHVAENLSTKFQIQLDPSQVCVVGSAKLGFGLFGKRISDTESLTPFREFRPDSDIDLAIISKELFECLWHELAIFANSQLYTPWNSQKLGDYFIYGWIRPDHFPHSARLRRCDDWWDCFRSLSSSRIFGYRTIRGGLYHSIEHLKYYQINSLNKCKKELEIQL